MSIEKIEIKNSQLEIYYKGGSPSPTPPKGDETVIMSYYGQWDVYGGKFAVPAYDGALEDIYDKITHLAYGFMGFNSAGEIGSWDWGADFGYYPAPSGGAKYAYSTDFYKLIDIINEIPQSFSETSNGYTVGSPLSSHKFPLDSILGNINDAPQFYRLAYAKYLKPELKIIVSFGGWEYGNANADTGWPGSPSPAEVFYNIVNDTEKLKKFINNIIDLIKNYKFQMIEFSGKYYPIPYTTPNGNVDAPSVHDEVINGKLAEGYKRVGKPFNLFSGVDIDWEYPYGCDQCAQCTGTDTKSRCPGGWSPNPTELSNSYNGYADLLSQLKINLPNPYFVSTTCGGGPADVNKLVSQKNIVDAFNKIDRISIMTYDFMNGNNIITHDSPLYNQTIEDKPWNADAAVHNMLNGGVSNKKINIGIPYYGRFQYITEETLTNLGYKEGVPTTEVTNNIFNGKTIGMYTACAQSNPTSITCPWTGTSTIDINSINYNVTPTSPTETDLTDLCGGNCNFNSIKSDFYEANDTKAGTTYYLSKDKYTNADILDGKDSRIILSMPSMYSIEQKTNYIKEQKLGGVITWMVGNDTGFSLAGKVADELMPKLKNIVTIAQETSLLSALVELLVEYDLVTTIQNAEELTVLAPANDAFTNIQSILATLEADVVKDILLSHVIVGTLFSQDLIDGMIIETLGSLTFEVKIKDGQVCFLAEGANGIVITADIEASNGVVHVIDTVLIPKIESTTPPPTYY